MSTSLKIVRLINECSKRNYDSTKSNHISFLQCCNSHLFHFFKSQIGDDFIFSALAYRSNSDKAFELVPNGSNTNYYFGSCAPEEIEHCIRELLDEAQEKKEIINLTNTLLKDNSGHDLFFINKDTDYTGIRHENATINFFTLGTLVFDDDISRFHLNHTDRVLEFKRIIPTVNNDNIKYARYLWHYKRIQHLYQLKNPDKPFFVHFIRPSIIEFDYNLLLALCTARELTTDELAFIDLIIYRIVAQTAREKVKEEKESYVLGVGHFLKHRTDPLEKKLNTLSHETLNSNLSQVIKDAFIDARLKAEIVNATAHIIDILAESTDQKKYFLNCDIRDKPTHCYDQCDLVNISEEIIKEFKIIDVKVVPKQEVSALVKPYLTNPTIADKFLPSSLIMRNIITEIIINTSNWAYSEPNASVKQLNISSANVENGEINSLIFFTNKIDNIRLLKLKNIFPSEDKYLPLPLDVIKRGGIFLLEKFFEKSGIGKILFKVSSTEMSFSISLNFNLL